MVEFLLGLFIGNFIGISIMTIIKGGEDKK